MKLAVDTLANTDLATAWSAYSNPDDITRVPNELVKYRMDDGREATVRFIEEPEGVRIRVEFDAEDQNPPEMQQQGWQAILDNFGRYVEGKDAAS